MNQIPQAIAREFLAGVNSGIITPEHVFSALLENVPDEHFYRLAAKALTTGLPAFPSMEQITQALASLAPRVQAILTAQAAASTLATASTRKGLQEPYPTVPKEDGRPPWPCYYDPRSMCWIPNMAWSIWYVPVMPPSGAKALKPCAQTVFEDSTEQVARRVWETLTVPESGRYELRQGDRVIEARHPKAQDGDAEAARERNREFQNADGEPAPAEVAQLKADVASLGMPAAQPPLTDEQRADVDLVTVLLNKGGAPDMGLTLNCVSFDSITRFSCAIFADGPRLQYHGTGETPRAAVAAAILEFKDSVGLLETSTTESCA